MTADTNCGMVPPMEPLFFLMGLLCVAFPEKAALVFAVLYAWTYWQRSR